MNIYVYHHGKLIRYPDLPDNINAEEFVANHYPLGEIQWGEYEEEEIIYDEVVDKEQEQQQMMFQNLHKEMEQKNKQMEQDGF